MPVASAHADRKIDAGAAPANVPDSCPTRAEGARSTGTDPFAHLDNGAPEALKLQSLMSTLIFKRSYAWLRVQRDAPEKAHPAVSLLVFPSVYPWTALKSGFNGVIFVYPNCFSGVTDSPFRAPIVHAFVTDSPCSNRRRYSGLDYGED